MLESLFNKAAGLKACNFIKKDTSAEVFLCEIYKSSKNTFFYRRVPVVASDVSFVVLFTAILRILI